MQGPWLLMFASLLVLAQSHPSAPLSRAYCDIQPECTSEDAGTKIPYIADCTKYIFCPLFGDGSIQDCPSPEHFSPTEKVCMDPALAGCPDCSNTTTTLAITTIPVCPVQPICTPENIYGTLPYIADCTKYIYCSPDGSEVLAPCPTGMHYSPTQDVCMQPELAGCPKCPGLTSTTMNPQCVQEHCLIEIPFVSLPYVANCTLYIYCKEDGSEDLRMCKAGEHFSPVERYCTDPATAQCPDCTGQDEQIFGWN